MMNTHYLYTLMCSTAHLERINCKWHSNTAITNTLISQQVESHTIQILLHPHTRHTATGNHTESTDSADLVHNSGRLFQSLAPFLILKFAPPRCFSSGRRWGGDTRRDMSRWRALNKMRHPRSGAITLKWWQWNMKCGTAASSAHCFLMIYSSL